MCRSFEVISGKVNKGNVEYLKGICKAAVDAGKDVTILDIPVELMEIDTRYQTENRTRRDLRYLTNAWNESKLLPLVGVPHWEEGKVYLVDGYGRWIASQIVDKEKYKELKVMVLLNAPQDKADDDGKRRVGGHADQLGQRAGHRIEAACGTEGLMQFSHRYLP